ncbi:MAG: PH domain-containing protein [candidate division KSB1 bacterium]|nr:PH domain-containing protein [candidate division KSB1 bacterium]
MNKKTKQTEYLDHPRPSTLYILMLLTVLIILCIPFLAVSFMINSSVRLYLFPFLILVFAIFGIFLHAAFSTVYKFKNKKLYIRCGIFFTRIPLADIQRIHKKRFIPRITGWNSRSIKGFNNRFANGLLILTQNRQVYISPTQPKEFTLSLQVYNGKPFPYTTFTSD